MLEHKPDLDRGRLTPGAVVFNLTQPGVKRVELTFEDRSRVLSLELPDACELRISGADGPVTEARARTIGPSTAIFESRGPAGDERARGRPGHSSG